MRRCRWSLSVRYQVLILIFSLAYGQHLIGSCLHFSKHIAARECRQINPHKPDNDLVFKAGQSINNNNALDDDLMGHEVQGNESSSKKIEHWFICDWPKSAWTHLSQASHYGQFVGYIPGGFVADYYGVKWVIFVAMIIISVSTSMSILFAPVHWTAFFGCRFLYGLAAGFMRPALWHYVVTWAPPLERCRFCSAVLAGHYLAFICNHFIWHIRNFPWNWKFHFLSIQVGIIVIPFFFLGSEKPSSCKRISELELLEIEEAQDGSISDTKVIPPYKHLWTSSAIWAETIIQFGDLWCMFTLVDLIPRYISGMLAGGGESYIELLVGVIPYICTAVASVGFGILGDTCVKRKWLKNTHTIRYMAVLSHIIPGIAVMSIGTVKRLGLCTIILISVGTLKGASVVSTVKSAMDQAPNFTGTIFSINLFFGQLATISAQLIKSFLSEYLPDDKIAIKWTLNFFVGGGMVLCTGMIFLFFASGDMHWWNNKRLLLYRTNQQEVSSLSKTRSKVTPFASLPSVASNTRR